MLGSISLAHAKSCVTLLLWALILGVAIARKVVVDDSETDKIIYSKGWAEFPGCLGCTRAPDLVQAHVNNGTWHRHVAYNSNNQLATDECESVGTGFQTTMGIWTSVSRSMVSSRPIFTQKSSYNSS